MYFCTSYERGYQVHQVQRPALENFEATSTMYEYQIPDIRERIGGLGNAKQAEREEHHISKMSAASRVTCCLHIIHTAQQTGNFKATRTGLRGVHADDACDKTL